MRWLVLRVLLLPLPLLLPPYETVPVVFFPPPRHRSQILPPSLLQLQHQRLNKNLFRPFHSSSYLPHPLQCQCRRRRPRLRRLSLGLALFFWTRRKRLQKLILNLLLLLNDNENDSWKMRNCSVRWRTRKLV